jgi:hypothetical protein
MTNIYFTVKHFLCDINIKDVFLQAHMSSTLQFLNLQEINGILHRRPLQNIQMKMVLYVISHLGLKLEFMV